jgi:nitrous oxide reductase accessory protein NosL
MGHELIPLETQADAEEFLQDHSGTRILRYKDVTLPLLLGLDEGRF